MPEPKTDAIRRVATRYLTAHTAGLRYRVNFGNGQVWGPMGRREAERYLAGHPDPRGAFIEFQDPETLDWFSVRHLGRRAYEEFGRDIEDGWRHGEVEPFEPSEGEGSQVPHGTKTASPASGVKGRITYSKFEGDREAKSCDVLLDGEPVGMITIENDEEFQGRASMRRTMRFSEVNVTLTGSHYSPAHDAAFAAIDGYTKDTGLKAAKAIVEKWLEQSGS